MYMKLISIFSYCTLFALTAVSSGPLGCSEDNQCSDGYFCEGATHLCRECLKCRDLGRYEPYTLGTNCIRSGAECGVCFNSLVYYNGNVDAKCVPEDELKRATIEIHILSLAILMTLIIIIIFIQVLRNTDVFRITYSSLTSISPRRYNKKEPQVPVASDCKI